MYRAVSRILSELRCMPANHAAGHRVHCTWITTCIPHWWLARQCTWLALEDILHQTHINFSPSFVLLFLCLLVYWRHISFRFPSRVRWADVVFAASGSRMSLIAFLFPDTSSLSAKSTALLYQWRLSQLTSSSSLVFSPKAGFGRNQSPVRRPVWLWHSAF